MSRVFAVGFPRWKRPLVCQCFPERDVAFVDRGAAVPADAVVALWGMLDARPPGLGPHGRVLRLEDGFLRSAGLGADIVRPLSWVVDDAGIYYDATRPSALERLLSTRPFETALLERAARLRARVVEQQITKYNVDHRSWQRPGSAGAGRRVILVPGQVESDASIAFGAPGIRRNMDLLRAVRAANPDAYLIYKPHPDVVARMRSQGVGEGEARRWCDEVVVDAAMGALLDAVDEVHVITSLAGFEALLRGKAVTCYGQPFYAGWGLTRDVLPPARRGRLLRLDELVAGALLEYPLYMSLDGKRLIAAEEALDSLVAWRTRTGGRNPWWHESYRTVVRWIAGVR